MTVSRRTKIILTLACIVAAGITAAVLFMLLRQPSEQDYVAIRNDLLKTVTKTQATVPERANAYFAAFKKELNATGSIEKARANSKSAYDAFKSAKAEATEATEKMAKNRAKNDADTLYALHTFTAVQNDRTAYLAGLVDSYATYQALFGGSDNKICMDIFIGSTSTLAERKEKLSAAAKDCYVAVSELKKSNNPTYVDFAKKLQSRMKQMESDAAVVAQSERDLASFTAEKDKYDARVSEALARNAPDDEVNQITKEIKQLNAKLDASRAEFDYSSKRYLKTVKEIPTIYDAVFTKDVARKLAYFDSLSDVRQRTLELIADDKIKSHTSK